MILKKGCNKLDVMTKVILQWSCKQTCIKVIFKIVIITNYNKNFLIKNKSNYTTIVKHNIVTKTNKEKHLDKKFEKLANI